MPEVGEWVRERHEEKRRKMMEMMKQLQGMFCLGVCGRHVGSLALLSMGCIPSKQGVTFAT